MAKTASPAQPAKPSAAKTKKARTPKTFELELGRGGQGILDQLANFRAERLAAERKEKPLKLRLKELYSPESDKLKYGDTLVIKALGVVRGTVSVRKRKNVDLDLLLQAFPEAYAACVSEIEYTQFDAS